MLNAGHWTIGKQLCHIEVDSIGWSINVCMHTLYVYNVCMYTLYVYNVCMYTLLLIMRNCNTLIAALHPVSWLTHSLYGMTT